MVLLLRLLSDLSFSLIQLSKHACAFANPLPNYHKLVQFHICKVKKNNNHNSLCLNLTKVMYYNLKDSYVLYHVILPKVLAMHHLAEEKVIVDCIQVVEYKLTLYFHCSSSAIVRKLVTEQTTAAHKKCWWPTPPTLCDSVYLHC